MLGDLKQIIRNVAVSYTHLVELGNQYLTVTQVSGELAQKVMNEALKYQGWKYVYGGSLSLIHI